MTARKPRNTQATCDQCGWQSKPTTDGLARHALDRHHCDTKTIPGYFQPSHPYQPTDWQEHAACHNADTNLFFPERGVNAGSAKGICRRCPVTAECLTYALSNSERFGIWGGHTDRERRQRKEAS